MKQVNDLPRGSVSGEVDGKRILYPFYTAWQNMFKRCSESFIAKNHTYKGCCVCDEWHKLSSFKKWFDDNNVNGWQLDKDLLVEGNKIYSPEYCRFVPASLNTILVGRDASRGAYPKGVSFDKDLGKYRAYISINMKTTHIGCYFTIEEAQAAYEESKRNYVLLVLPVYKEMGVSKDLIETLEKRFS